jgi:hypothetical protein
VFCGASARRFVGGFLSCIPRGRRGVGRHYGLGRVQLSQNRFLPELWI